MEPCAARWESRGKNAICYHPHNLIYRSPCSFTLSLDYASATRLSWAKYRERESCMRKTNFSANWNDNNRNDWFIKSQTNSLVFKQGLRFAGFALFVEIDEEKPQNFWSQKWTWKTNFRQTFLWLIPIHFICSTLEMEYRCLHHIININKWPANTVDSM